jgi:hypothetical protein
MILVSSLGGASPSRSSVGVSPPDASHFDNCVSAVCLAHAVAGWAPLASTSERNACALVLVSSDVPVFSHHRMNCRAPSLYKLMVLGDSSFRAWTGKPVGQDR